VSLLRTLWAASTTPSQEARVKIKDQTIWLLQVIDGRSPGMDFDDARLHEAHQAREVVDHNHRLFVSGLNAADTLVQSFPGMLGEKTFCSCPGGAAHQAQRPAGDIRENPIGDVIISLMNWNAARTCGPNGGHRLPSPFLIEGGADG
jgi:hypothetical protein